MKSRTPNRPAAVAKAVIETLVERIRELQHEIERANKHGWEGGMADLNRRVCDHKREKIAMLNAAIRYIDQYLDI